MLSNTTFRVRALVAVLLLSAIGVSQPAAAWQQPTEARQDTAKYPLTDRRTDLYTTPNRNTFDFSDTAYLKRNIEYDPVTRQYYVIEKIGNQFYRTPMTFSMKEFMALQARKDENEYFRKRANTLFDLNRRNVRPVFGFSKDWMNRVTGNLKPEIRPSGYVDIAAGYQGQNIKNPTLPERAEDQDLSTRH